MVSLTAKITGSACWGGGVSAFTVYQIEVAYKNENWSIFRRFSEFVQFHLNLMSEIGNIKFAELGLVLPEKNFTSNMSHIVQKRRQQLQIYLDKICIIENVDTFTSVHNFLDFSGKGVPDMQVELGKNMFLKQTFAKVKYSSSPLLEAWKTFYIVLTKNKIIYVFRSYYDPVSKCYAKIPLESGNIRLTSKGSKLIINLFVVNNQHHFQLKLNNNDEFANWLRVVSDFCLSKDNMDASFGGPRYSESQVPNSQPHRFSFRKSFSSLSSSSHQAPLQEPKVTHIHAQGTGNTTDELSAMYGI